MATACLGCLWTDTHQSLSLARHSGDITWGHSWGLPLGLHPLSLIQQSPPIPSSAYGRKAVCASDKGKGRDCSFTGTALGLAEPSGTSSLLLTAPPSSLLHPSSLKGILRTPLTGLFRGQSRSPSQESKAGDKGTLITSQRHQEAL